MKPFRDEAVRALSAASGLAPEAIDRVLDVPGADRGDFAFPCFALAKERKAPPPKIAAEIAARVVTTGRIASAVAAGPYVNLLVDRPRLIAETHRRGRARGRRASASGTEGRGRTVVVDFSSPNVAKPLAFHHLRSTMIGNALTKLYAARGWTVVGINHLGDWGTGFGKLLVALELYGDAPLVAGDPRALERALRADQRGRSSATPRSRSRRARGSSASRTATRRRARSGGAAWRSR